MSGYDLSVLWSSSPSLCLSLLNSHTKTKFFFFFNSSSPRKQLNLQFRKEKNTPKFNNCGDSSVFIIFFLLADGDDLLVTSCIDLNWGPFGEPFHHLNSTSSNSHDLMHCRMPEICCLCFLFSPSFFSHQQQGQQDKAVSSCELLGHGAEAWHVTKIPEQNWTGDAWMLREMCLSHSGTRKPHHLYI